MSQSKPKRHQRMYTVDIQHSKLKKTEKLKNKSRKRIKSQFGTTQIRNDNQYIDQFQILYKRKKGINLEESSLVRNSIIQAAQNAIKKIEKIEKQKQLISMRKIASMDNKNIKSNYQKTQKYGRFAQHKNSIIINLLNTKYSVIQNVVDQLSMTTSFDNDILTGKFEWDFKWTDMSLGPQFIKKMTKDQRINYFIGIQSIARKNLLMINLYTMKKCFPRQYNYFPQTFQYPNDIRKINKFYKDSLKKKISPTFIVKPEASCQGKGIYLCQDLSEINTSLKSIVQQYISSPMLYEGLKFDFRVYVLLKSISPLQIYVYKQGLVRLATEKYQQPNQKNLDNLFLHLTNYAINKNNPKYQFNKTFRDLNYGHKKSLAEFFKSLDQDGHSSIKCWRQIKQNIVKTILSVQPHLQYQYRKAQPKNQNQSLCYQILGFDFMMDNNMKVYLLQVNQSPSFSTETPLDFIVKNYLIKDTFQIIMYDKVRKKLNLQLRSEKANQFKRNTQIDVQAQIPKKILGNFEQIYPSIHQSSQRQYQQMLEYSKAYYHNRDSVDMESFTSQNSYYQSIKRPELKLISNGQGSSWNYPPLRQTKQIRKPKKSQQSFKTKSHSNVLRHKKQQLLSLRKQMLKSQMKAKKRYQEAAKQESSEEGSKQSISQKLFGHKSYTIKQDEQQELPELDELSNNAIQHQNEYHKPRGNKQQISPALFKLNLVQGLNEQKNSTQNENQFISLNSIKSYSREENRSSFSMSKPIRYVNPIQKISNQRQSKDSMTLKQKY